jgi:hypothetical protein
VPERDPQSFYADGAAIIAGWPAWAIARMLTRSCGDQIADLPALLRAPVEDGLEALRRAGGRWAASASGNSEAMPAEVPVSSEHDDEISTREAADMLRLSDRRIRQLATDGRLAGRQRQGRWVLDRGAVIAHKTKGATP